MSFSQSAALNVVPIIARLVLAAVFIPAGYNKLMKEADFAGDDAKRLRELGVVASAGPAATSWAPANDSGILLASRLQAVPNGSTSPNSPPSAPPSKPSTDESASAAPPSRPTDAGSAPGATGEPIKARSLHRVTLMLDKLGWPQQTYLAWLAAVTEFVGGICLVLGLFSRMWGLGLAITMVVAFYLTSYEQVMSTKLLNLQGEAFSRFSSQIALFALAFGLALTGPGALSIDRRLTGGGGSGKKPASDA
jgi:uncharacterized membrane protein YphA (DoxX/SURF4 family)